LEQKNELPWNAVFWGKKYGTYKKRKGEKQKQHREKFLKLGEGIKGETLVGKGGGGGGSKLTDCN